MRCHGPGSAASHAMIQRALQRPPSLLSHLALRPASGRAAAGRRRIGQAASKQATPTMASIQSPSADSQSGGPRRRRRAEPATKDGRSAAAEDQQHSKRWQQQRQQQQQPQQQQQQQQGRSRGSDAPPHPPNELACPHFGACSGCTLAAGLASPPVAARAAAYFESLGLPAGGFRVTAGPPARPGAPRGGRPPGDRPRGGAAGHRGGGAAGGACGGWGCSARPPTTPSTYPTAGEGARRGAAALRDCEEMQAA